MSLPSYLQPYLWSYDLSKMDKEKNSRLIITQVLNYGDQKAIDWIFANYSSEAIKNALLHPLRGVWDRDRLRKWLSVFSLMIDPLEFESAIMDLTPREKLHGAFFQRKGLLHDKVLPWRLKQKIRFRQ